MEIPSSSCLVNTTVLHTKINEVENKMPHNSSLVTSIILNANISEAENEIPDHSIYILLLLNLLD